MSMRISVVAMLALLMAVGTSVAQPPREGRGGPPREGQRPGRGGGFQMPSFPLLTALDANKDGKLSASEIENAVVALKKLDKDSDGKLSQEEIGWPPRGPRRGAPGGAFGGPGAGRGGPGGPGGGVDMVERIMRNDKDGDGKVTREELPEFMQRMLDRADTNKDGAIDKAEAKVMSEAFSRGGGFGRGAGGARGAGQGDAPRRPQRPPADGNRP